MPERPKYERLGDEEQGIEMKPTHAYLDGDTVVPEAKKEVDETPATGTGIGTGTAAAVGVGAAAGATAGHLYENPTTPTGRMPRTSSGVYPVHDGDEYYAPPPPIAAAAGRSSPVRRDYSPSPVRSSYRNETSGMYSNSAYDRGYDQGHQGGYSGGYSDRGGYRDDYAAPYNDSHTQYYESSRGGYGSSRGGGFNV
jgi:hypothetical protein